MKWIKVDFFCAARKHTCIQRVRGGSDLDEVESENAVNAEDQYSGLQSDKDEEVESISDPFLTRTLAISMRYVRSGVGDRIRQWPAVAPPEAHEPRAAAGGAEARARSVGPAPHARERGARGARRRRPTARTTAPAPATRGAGRRGG
jgi:hypothetical protein